MLVSTSTSAVVAARIGDIWASGRAALIEGNIADLHVGPDQVLMGHERLLAAAAAARGRAAIWWSPGRGTRQIVVPGGISIGFALPDRTADPARALCELRSRLHEAAAPIVLFVDWLTATKGLDPSDVEDVVVALGAIIGDRCPGGDSHRVTVVVRPPARTPPALTADPRIVRLACDLPNLDERRELFEILARRGDRRPDICAALDRNTTSGDLASATAGRTLRELAQAARRQAEEGIGLSTSRLLATLGGPAAAG